MAQQTAHHSGDGKQCNGVPEGIKTRWEIHETARMAFHLHASAGLGF